MLCYLSINPSLQFKMEIFRQTHCLDILINHYIWTPFFFYTNSFFFKIFKYTYTISMDTGSQTLGDYNSPHRAWQASVS